ncbi:hypothetical protein BCR43DRAFT_500012 [Syncephalastrum racemosum]|uniref:Uncharacterized protein n=1 Tax=Syncephalastrum racemosum TaxID=13706 RepID=A0A1X2GZ75_SYNRA|nr:hypothetical protein BCR43DRAFT_500012 [Syncephalastrum racemosum]
MRITWARGGMISRKRNGAFREQIGYLKVQNPQEAGNHNACNNDLLELGMLCKQAIEDDNLRTCLAIHAVGFLVHFYLMEPQADGLYLLTEVVHLYFPRSVEDLLEIVNSANKLKDVLRVFETRGIVDVNGRDRVKRNTPAVADLEAVTVKSQ